MTTRFFTNQSEVDFGIALVFLLNASSKLFMVGQVFCVLSNAEYLLLPIIRTMQPKKLNRDETVHAQISETVSGPNWILY
jgi:hypothetical protein